MARPSWSSHQNLPAPGAGTTGGAVGWRVIIYNADGIKPGYVFRTRVIEHTAQTAIIDSTDPTNPIDLFRFSPDIPATSPNSKYTFYFYYKAPTSADMDAVAAVNAAAAIPPPTGKSTGKLPTGYVLHTGINPDIQNGPNTQMVAGNPNTFYVRRNENGQNLPAPTSTTGTTGGAVGWTMVLVGPTTGIAAGERFSTKVINHKANNALWDGSPGPFDMFQFSPDLPALMGNNTYAYYFAPLGPKGTAMAGGRRSCRSRRSRRSRRSGRGSKRTRKQ